MSIIPQYLYLRALFERRTGIDQRGQASAEYALVLLGAAAIALLIVAWAAKSGAVEELFDFVLKTIRGRAEKADSANS